MAYCFFIHSKTTQRLRNDQHNNTKNINSYLARSHTFGFFEKIVIVQSFLTLWSLSLVSLRQITEKTCSIAAELGMPVLYLRKALTQGGTREKIPIAFVFSMLAL